MTTKRDAQVLNIVSSFGGAQFTDILNRLWMMGIPPETLQKALATTSNGTNDPSDIVARLMNLPPNPDGSPQVTLDQLQKAPQVPVPEIPGAAWPFQPDHKDQNGVVVPVNTNPYAQVVDQTSGKYIPPAQTQIAAPPPPLAIPQTQAAPKTNPRAKPIVNVTKTGDGKKLPDLSTPAGIAEYERQNYGNMLWVKSVPELAKAIEEGAKAQDSPAAFQARLEQTDWWKTHDENSRHWQTIKADPATYASALDKNGKNIRAIAGSMGINLNDDQVNQLADQQGQFNWDPHLIQQNVVNMAQYDPKQGGLIGEEVGKIKSLSKSYLLPISDTDAWNYAKQIEAGGMTEESVTGNFRQMAKTSFPALADIIDKGGIPAQAMSGQIGTAAQLLEVDPNTIDLTTPEYSDIIGHADDKGNIRPMTVYETSKFVKSKDAYWKTANASKDVSSMMESVGQIFGKQAI